jgi:hypothetical protein
MRFSKVRILYVFNLLFVLVDFCFLGESSRQDSINDFEGDRLSIQNADSVSFFHQAADVRV